MPTITVPALREAFINIVVSSPRDEAVPSTIIREAALQEYQHLGENDSWVSPAKQLATYFASGGAGNFYAVRSLMPAGTIVEVNEDFLLDVMRLRYSVVFAVLPAALQADARVGLAFNRHFQAALQGLLTTGWSLTNVFIPGDPERRPGDRTEIEVMIELGGYQGRLRYDKSP